MQERNWTWVSLHVVAAAPGTETFSDKWTDNV